MKGPERDIHSGNDGGVFNEPLSDLTKLLASLVDSRNNIMVPGFYNGVRPNTLGAALQRLDTCHEFSLEGYREALGIPKLASAANMRLAIMSFVAMFNPSALCSRNVPCKVGFIASSSNTCVIGHPVDSNTIARSQLPIFTVGACEPRHTISS